MILGLTNTLLSKRKVGVSYSPEVTAYIARLNNEGFAVPSKANLIALDNLLVSPLKEAGIWSTLDIIEIWAQDSNSANAGRVNLVSPSDTLATLYNAITFTNKVGVQGDGVSAYIDTGYNPSTYAGNYGAGNNFNAVWVNSAATGATAVLGISDASIFRVYNAGTSNHALYSGLTGFANLSGTGWLAANKKTTSTASLFKDTTEVSVTGMLDFTIPDRNNLIFRTQTLYSDAGIGIYMGGANQTANNTAIRTAVSNYLTAVAAL